MYDMPDSMFSRCSGSTERKTPYIAIMLTVDRIAWRSSLSLADVKIPKTVPAAENMDPEVFRGVIAFADTCTDIECYLLFNRGW